MGLLTCCTILISSFVFLFFFPSNDNSPLCLQIKCFLDLRIDLKIRIPCCLFSCFINYLDHKEIIFRKIPKPYIERKKTINSQTAAQYRPQLARHQREPVPSTPKEAPRSRRFKCFLFCTFILHTPLILFTRKTKKENIEADTV